MLQAKIKEPNVNIKNDPLYAANFLLLRILWPPITTTAPTNAKLKTTGALKSNKIARPILKITSVILNGPES
ncbi:hypothetical protein CL642_00715 [bacterium]|nr:hypothetical protein [bacterium]